MIAKNRSTLPASWVTFKKLQFYNSRCLIETATELCLKLANNKDDDDENLVSAVYIKVNFFPFYKTG